MGVQTADVVPSDPVAEVGGHDEHGPAREGRVDVQVPHHEVLVEEVRVDLEADAVRRDEGVPEGAEAGSCVASSPDGVVDLGVVGEERDPRLSVVTAHGLGGGVGDLERAHNRNGISTLRLFG